LEYFDYSELEEESSFIEEKNRSLIKKKIQKVMMIMEIKLYNNLRIKDSSKINSLSSSTPPKKLHTVVFQMTQIVIVMKILQLVIICYH
jgi:hypothetical protein